MLKRKKKNWKAISLRVAEKKMGRKLSSGEKRQFYSGMKRELRVASEAF